MNFICTSFYYANSKGENFKELADQTFDNLEEYCRKWGYRFEPYILQEEIEGTAYEVAVKACRKNSELLLKTLEDNHSCDYVWHRDCDSIITNMDISLESIIGKYPSPPYEIIVGSDKAGLSMGQVLVHNTPTGRQYLQDILDGIDRGEEHEQTYMGKNMKGFIAVVPQRVMNSYDCEARLEPDDPGNWQAGDFLVHLAGLNLNQKMEVLPKWMSRVIKNYKHGEGCTCKLCQ
jgi:hypothetical protein